MSAILREQIVERLGLINTSLKSNSVCETICIKLTLLLQIKYNKKEPILFKNRLFFLNNRLFFYLPVFSITSANVNTIGVPSTVYCSKTMSIHKFEFAATL